MGSWPLRRVLCSYPPQPPVLVAVLEVAGERLGLYPERMEFSVGRGSQFIDEGFAPCVKTKPNQRLHGDAGARVSRGAFGTNKSERWYA